MHPNHGHQSKGKGKGKAKVEDFADHFGGLSLGDHTDARIPRNGQPSYQYDQPDYSTWEQYPPGSIDYTHQSASSHATGSDPAYAAGYGGALNTPGRAFSFGSNYAPSSYDTSSSHASSYAPSEDAASSYAASVSTVQSSTPPRYETNTVNHDIARQQQPRNRYELPCEFGLLTGCSRRFQGGEEREWKDHHWEHLNGNFPAKLKCWFCSTFVYDSNDRDCDGDKNYNFDRRMEHIREHIMGDGYSASGMRPDGDLIWHLRRERIISSQAYKDIMVRVNPTTAPPIPGGRHSRSSEHVEEIASSSRTRRHEKKEKHESAKKKHMR